MGIVETLVVEGSNDGLTGTSGCYNQVPIALVYLSLNSQLVEDGLLMRQDVIFLQHPSNTSVHLVALRDGGYKAVVIVVLEVVVVPIGVKRGKGLLDDMRILLMGDAHIPLQALRQGRARDIGRTDISRIHATLSDKDIRLGVQPV